VFQLPMFICSRAVAEGTLLKPKVWDPFLQILWDRGAVHEQNYVEHLTQAGLEVVRIDGVHVTDEAVSETLAAIKEGAQVIAQGRSRTRAGLVVPTSSAVLKSGAPSETGRTRQSTRSSHAKRKQGPSSSCASILIC
jgi:hypothetical protein